MYDGCRMQGHNQHSQGREEGRLIAECRGRISILRGEKRGSPLPSYHRCATHNSCAGAQLNSFSDDISGAVPESKSHFLSLTHGAAVLHFHLVSLVTNVPSFRMGR